MSVLGGRNHIYNYKDLYRSLKIRPKRVHRTNYKLNNAAKFLKKYRRLPPKGKHIDGEFYPPSVDSINSIYEDAKKLSWKELVKKYVPKGVPMSFIATEYRKYKRDNVGKVKKQASKKIKRANRMEPFVLPPKRLSTDLWLEDEEPSGNGRYLKRVSKPRTRPIARRVLNELPSGNGKKLAHSRMIMGGDIISDMIKSATKLISENPEGAKHALGQVANAAKEIFRPGRMFGFGKHASFGKLGRQTKANRLAGKGIFSDLLGAVGFGFGKLDQLHKASSGKSKKRRSVRFM